jgi:hypothetical protein
MTKTGEHLRQETSACTEAVPCQSDAPRQKIGGSVVTHLACTSVDIFDHYEITVSYRSASTVVVRRWWARELEHEREVGEQ